LWWFLVTALSDTRFERTGDVITHQFVAKSEGMFNLSDVLLAQLFWNRDEKESIDWLAERHKGLPGFAKDFKLLLDRALEVGAVRYVFRQAPQMLPNFLKEPDQAAGMGVTP
jgi:hypothetical protein